MAASRWLLALIACVVIAVLAGYGLPTGSATAEPADAPRVNADRNGPRDGKARDGEDEDEDDDEDEDEDEDEAQARWTTDFSAEKRELTSTGRNPYFVLEPGYQLVLEDGQEQLTVTVLGETKIVDGVKTRVVEERETKNGKLVEVSRNFFAISRRTNSVYYFGEEVDIYQDGKVVSHEGAWLAGEKGAKFGLMLPGLPLVGSRYYQEVAPGVAMDRAEIASVGAVIEVPAGEFNGCLRLRESTPLEPGKTEYKSYAPGVGLLKDGSLTLVRYGTVELPRK